MSKRRNGSAALARSEPPAETNATAAPSVPASEMPHSTTGTYNAVEAVFFKKGDLGLIEPPVYLPKNPIFVPVIGFLFFAGLTAFVLL